ncbi:MULTISPECIES: phosphatidate cytidylyltransferase [Pseudothermotoga]|nr:MULTISPECIES: phosphatidate cytidylyltransferase [Pseudothermotoga]KUK20099.1 MAG: Phosphatidate cytidylyltransferase [Pseudothermotoga lettingae]MDI3494903.1 phosphatidate cytidylyltransferase [Pseudothermotoga sp.]MDK2885050.1 phosphatidate cytidylyltransferase [Pseudothermotoga sp.]GLI48706.1 phosphatidate cytidylyltransferase [Pseudothermotoga lettingae TMO]HBJ82198.1 phosphatidate cytidylyltransferase [Pseudothermotoga sp.]
MAETKTRLITALIVAPFVVACFINYNSLIGLVAAVVLLASYELLNMAILDQQHRIFLYFGVSISVGFTIVYGIFQARNGMLLLCLAFILNGALSVLTIKKISIVWNTVLASSLSLLYIAGCLSFFFPLYLKFGAANALLNLTAVWLYDTGAYFAGLRWGKTKIAKHISPSKSLEGIFGGFLTAIAFSVVYKICFELIFHSEVMPFKSLVIFSLTIAIFDTFGDIFESALKRYFNLKDSGNVLPGHGGMLDRIDGLLFVTPVTYFLFTLGIL